MKQSDMPEVSIQLWPPKIIVKGKDALQTMRGPLRFILCAVALFVVMLALAELLAGSPVRSAASSIIHFFTPPL